MENLFTTFSVEQIIFYAIMLGIAIKGVWDFVDWCIKKYKNKFNKDYEAKSKEELLEQHYLNCKEQHIESMQRYNDLETKIGSFMETVNTKVDNIEGQLKQLTISDMHDIKGWIVEKHHKVMKKGWIDDFTMDILEKRYNDYLKEGGNSYIANLMDEMRGLPHTPPKDNNAAG